MRIRSILVCTILAVSSVAHAEIEKLVVSAEKGVAFHWWPKLSPVEGWHQDREHSLRYSINALAPDGTSFKDADAVIYAKAIYKPQVRDTPTIDALIEKDKKDFLSNVPGVEIEEVAALSTADGQKLRSFTYFSKGHRFWERVSYGEEEDFYLLFTISSSSLAALNSATSAYEKIISNYKK